MPTEPTLGLRGFLRALIAEGPSRLVWVILVQAVAGLGQAVGILLLVPLLGAVGVTARSSTTSGSCRRCSWCWPSTLG